MDSQIQVFNFKGEDVRVVHQDGQVWFIAKDICDYFGDTNRSRTMQGLSEDEKGYTQMTTPGGVQSIAIVNESGLYAMLFAMQPEKARGVSDDYIAYRHLRISEFKRWVTHEVLPSIRKHGAYMTPEMIEKTLTNPDFIIGLATRLKEEQEKTRHLEMMVEADKPKVLFADAVSVSSSEILVGELAKLLKQNGVDIGQNRLFEKLRNDGYLMKQGSSKNMPTQKSMDMGLFRIKETVINKPDGSVLITRTPKITGRGQCYFVNYFLNGKEAA